jgi:serine/threonine protein kinase
MPKPGQRLGEYVLVDRIGQGAFGEVWRARHNAWSDQIVAIKIPTDTQYVRNLQREGIAVHRLNHACIVKAINFDPFGDPPYLVMEYVPGWSLRQFIQQGPMEVDCAVAVMNQVVAALHYAHQHGLIHRDVKPENILIHKAVEKKGFVLGSVKLTDFGLGKVAVESESKLSAAGNTWPRSRWTEVRSMAGPTFIRAAWCYLKC